MASGSISKHKEICDNPTIPRWAFYTRNKEEAYANLSSKVPSNFVGAISLFSLTRYHINLYSWDSNCMRFYNNTGDSSASVTYVTLGITIVDKSFINDLR